MTLAGVVPLPHPLDPVPGESDRDHAAFALWVVAPRRTTPHDPALASRNRWAERASEYDALRAPDATEPWEATEARLRGVVSREIRKLERASVTAPIGIQIPRDLVTAFLAVRGLPDVPGAVLPVEDMTVEELRTVEAADAVLARVRKVA